MKKKKSVSKTTKEKINRAIVPAVNQEIVVNDLHGIDGLIATAIQSKASVENLKELMAMKYEHEAREAKREFYQKFSALQADLPVIIKTKQVDTKAGKKIYK
jgi:hypothetical protein